MASPISKLLSPGDVVYHVSGKKMIVKNVGSTGFTTSDDYFIFSEVRKLYFLTLHGLKRYLLSKKHPLR